MLKLIGPIDLNLPFYCISSCDTYRTAYCLLLMYLEVEARLVPSFISS